MASETISEQSLSLSSEPSSVGAATLGMTGTIGNAPQVHVVFTSDDKGVSQLTVAVYTLFLHANPARITIVWGLSDGISDSHKEALRSLARPYGNCSLEFVEACPILEAEKLSLSSFCDI